MYTARYERRNGQHMKTLSKKQMGKKGRNTLFILNLFYMPQNQNERPGDKGWTLTIEEHEAIQGLGRRLHSEVLKFAKEQSGGTMHMKIVVGAIGYLKEIFEEKKLALSLDVTMCQKLIEDNNLGELINEPYFVPEDVKIEVRRQEEEARTRKENTEVIEGTPIDENQTSIPLDEVPENAPVEADEQQAQEENNGANNS